MKDYAEAVGPAFRVTEIFGPTIQGEGSLIGQTSHFVRFAGCDSRCTWCDTKGSVEPLLYLQDGSSEQLKAPEIYDRVKALGRASWVTLSGGNPALFDLGELVLLLKQDSWRIAVETQGTVYNDWLDYVDMLTISPKPPSAKTNTASKNTLDKMTIARRIGTTCLKFVVRNDDDFNFACKRARQYYNIPSYVQPCNLEHESNYVQLARLRWLAGKVLDLQRLDTDFTYNFTVLPQMHKLMEVR